MAERPTSPAAVPEIVPVFPLSGALLLPQTHRPLNIFEPRYLALVDHMLKTDRLVGLVQPEDTSEESPKGRVALNRIGCLGRLIHFEETDDDRYVIVLDGICRFELIGEETVGTPFRQARISTRRFARDFEPDSGADKVDRKRFLSLMRSYAEFAQIELDWDEIDRTGTADLVNLACMLGPHGPREKQVLLEASTLNDRAETLMAIAELEMARSQSGTTLQ